MKWVPACAGMTDGLCGRSSRDRDGGTEGALPHSRAAGAPVPPVAAKGLQEAAPQENAGFDFFFRQLHPLEGPKSKYDGRRDFCPYSIQLFKDSP